MKNRLFRTAGAIALAVSLAACATSATTTPKLNSNGTAVNAAEQVAGGLYATYDALDTAWLGYLITGPASAAKVAAIAAVEPKRKAARAMLDQFAMAAVAGTSDALVSDTQLAVTAFGNALAALGIQPASVGT